MCSLFVNMAKSVSSQIHGYSTSCRRVTVFHFDCFLVVMFELHNDMLAKHLAVDGHEPRKQLQKLCIFVMHDR